MIKLGELVLDRRIPRIAVAFSAAAHLQHLPQYKAAGLDVAEIRLDLFADRSRHQIRMILDAFKAASLTTLLTLRSQAEGGKWDDDESGRLALIGELSAEVDAVDIELSAFLSNPGSASAALRQVRSNQKAVIVSHHDFHGVPRALSASIARAFAVGADIVKIACMVRDNDDIRALAAILMAHPEQHLIVIGMGPAGRVTRTAFPALGSLLTFASIPGNPTAPGQPEFRELLAELRSCYPAFASDKDSVQPVPIHPT